MSFNTSSVPVLKTVPLINLEPTPTLEVDYKTCRTKITGVHFLRECCSKMKANILTMATATTYFHRFFSLVKFDDYDPYLIACTCIYLASKVVNDDIKIRDIINVGYHTIHKREQPLSLDPYFELRDSLVEAELLLMRMLSFDLKVDLPHKHLLFYLNSLRDWLPSSAFKEMPIVEVCWSILNDSYHLPFVLDHSPQLIAGTIIHLVLQIYGVVVPGCEENVGKPWYSYLSPDCKTNDVWNLASKIMKVYVFEKDITKSKTDH